GGRQRRVGRAGGRQERCGRHRSARGDGRPQDVRLRHAAGRGRRVRAVGSWSAPRGREMTQAAWPPSPRLTPPPDGSPYWAPEETLAPEAREAIVLEKLRGQLRYSWERSTFYRRLWSDAGVSPDDLRELSDLALFPFVTKQELRAGQLPHPPYAANGCGDA